MENLKAHYGSVSFWICAECGQDSKDSSEFCEICNAPRATAETTLDKVVHTHHETFEIDGQQIAYQPTIRRIGIVE